MNRFSLLMLLAGCVIAAVAEERSAAQTLPTAGDEGLTISRRNENRRIVRTDLEGRAARARDALRRGDVRSMSQELAGPDFVVDFDESDLDYNQRTLAQAMLAFAKGNYQDAGRKAEEVMVAELRITGTYYLKPGKLLSDAYQLLALTSLQMGVLTVADKYAVYAQAGTNDYSHVGAWNLIKLIREMAGDYKCEGFQKLVSRQRTRDVHAIACRSSRPDVQPLAVVVEINDYAGTRVEGLFSAALTVDADGDRQPRQYRLVYRDRLLPPLTLLHCGTTIPDASELLKFIGDFAGDEWVRRAQMEALYFQQAEIAPLAAHWARKGGVDDALLKAQVKQPLEAAGNWDWKIYSSRIVESGRGAPYEVVEYRNVASEKAERLGLAIPLEHVYFAVGSTEDRRYLASYRLVSESVAAGERIYFVQRVAGQQVSILDVQTEAPDSVELMNRILTWISQGQ